MSSALRIPKLSVAFLSILALVIALVFAPISKADASVSWGQEVTEVAKHYIGVKYKPGGTTPKGFDASGYTKYVFEKSAAHIKLPRTSQQQYKVGKSVSKNAIKEGDLVYFNINGKGVSCVGIALGNGKFIVVTTSKGVAIQSFSTKYWKDRYAGAKRVLK